MLNLIEKMLNFNGMDSSDFSVATHHNSIYGSSVTSTLGSDQTSCQIGASFGENANYISKPMQVVHSASALSDNKSEFGVHCGTSNYIGTENVKRFSVNNLLKLANCGVDRVIGKNISYFTAVLFYNSILTVQIVSIIWSLNVVLLTWLLTVYQSDFVKNDL